MTKTMGKFKKLIPAICMLLISAVLMGTSTFAWFSMNKTVTASGMQVKATAEGSIVITTNANLPVAGTKATDVSLASDVTTLYASTHDSTYETYSSGLKHITNADQINPETGIKLNNQSGFNLEYENAANSTGTGAKTYFKDYTVYIAGDGQEFLSQDLVVTLSGSWATSSKTINKAISVDFYGQSVNAEGTTVATSAATFKGTLNVAGLKNSNDYTSAAYTTFTISNIVIPKTGTNAAYAILMRVYFDGALVEVNGSQAYTQYTKITDADAKAAEGVYYYNDQYGTSVATTVVNTTVVTGLYQVTTTEGTNAKTFARTTTAADCEDVTLVASFKAQTHTGA